MRRLAKANACGAVPSLRLVEAKPNAAYLCGEDDTD